MKRHLPIYLLLCFSVFAAPVFSQAASTYTFSSTNTAPYNYLPGNGTSLVTGFTWANQVFTNVPIGFTFYFEGKPYNSVGVSSNGFIWFGTGTVSSTESNPVSDASLGTGIIAGVVSAFGTPLEAFPSTMTDGSDGGSLETGTPEISYADVSTGCSEVFVVQWKGAASTSNTPFEGSGSSSSFGSQTLGDDNRIDLQIHLSATTNEISILVRTFPYPYPEGDQSSGEVGVRGAANTDFSSLEVTNTCTIFNTHPYWQVSAQTTNNAEMCTNDPCYPAAGGTNYTTNASYSFTPAACSYTAPTVSTNAGCGNNGTIDINVSNGSGIYAYVINNGTTADTNATGQFSGLGAGTYSTAVTNGICAVTGCTTITSSSSNATAQNNGPVCAGGNVTLSTPTQPGAVYHWTGPNGYTSSQQNPVINNITSADTGIYTIVDSIGSCASGAGTTDVGVSGTATPPTVTAQPTKICSSDSSLVCASTGYSNYLWNDMVDTSRCIYVNAAGNYYVTASDNGSCSAQSNDVSISIYPVPSVSIIQTGDTLASYGESAYQWYFGEQKILGATQPVYIATQAGDYEVQITDTNGCSALSSPVAVTGVRDLTQNVGFEIFPNPASSGSIQLIINTECVGCEIQMIDATGRIVYESEVKGSTQFVDISKLAKGAYIIKIAGGVKQFIRD